MAMDLFNKQVSAPSNIAILKYWGKSNGQFSLNPSLSFTLKHSKTFLDFTYEKRQDKEIIIQDFLFNGFAKESFKSKIEQKIKKYFNQRDIPFGCNIKINTSNTFPHSSGIASSASSMAALAKMFSMIYDTHDVHQQSSMAREFSGSACRSIQEGWCLWGETQDVLDSSQEHAILMNSSVHPDFHSLQDWIFVCSDQAKAVSSSDGHQLMNQHPFKDARVKNAHERLSHFLQLLEVTPSNTFFDLCEQEALELHALMMTSTPSVLLMEPESLLLIKKISKLRQRGIMCGFTLDAGSSVHLLFPKNQLPILKNLLDEEYFGTIKKDYIEIIQDECSLC